jgi:hypothetical protein
MHFIHPLAIGVSFGTFYCRVRDFSLGERKHYYELEKNGFLQSIKQRAIVAGISRDIAYEGLKVLPGNDRLKALGDAYGFLADQLPRLIDKYTKSHL